MIVLLLFERIARESLPNVLTVFISGDVLAAEVAMEEQKDPHEAKSKDQVHQFDYIGHIEAYAVI